MRKATFLKVYLIGQIHFAKKEKKKLRLCHMTHDVTTKGVANSQNF